MHEIGIGPFFVKQVASHGRGVPLGILEEDDHRDHGEKDDAHDLEGLNE
jgi:hypothetical protein